MPIARNPEDGVGIHYETFGDRGPPVVLHHGFSRSILEWKPDYTDVLAERYRLVAMDSRGHGQSDKPRDPSAYGLSRRADDVVHVLDAVGFDAAHYVGYSMGGMVGFAVAKRAPDRLRSLVIGGMHPYAVDTADAEVRAASLAQGVARHVAKVEVASGRFPEPFRTEFLSNDGEALAALVRAGRDMALEEGIEGMSLPALLYAGDRDGFHDGAAKAAAAMPDARFVSLPGLDHLQAVLQAHEALPVILEFLDAQSAR